MCTEGTARKIIGQAGAQTLVDVVTRGWKRYQDEGVARPVRTRANIVWDYMVEEAQDAFGSWENVRQVQLHNSPAFVLSEYMTLRFKKHDRQLLTHNVETRAQVVLSAQGLFPGMNDLPVVSCGYVLDTADADIERIVVARRVAGRLEWSIDLEALAAGNVEPTTMLFPGMDDYDPTQLPTIRPTRKSAEDERE